ncbi:MAG: 2-oxoacid:ferredoxin oxidoreductase subunit beta [Fimbriimonadaceae bacterium]
MSAVADYLRLCHFPVIWCAGCGNGIVMQAMIRAIKKLELPQDSVSVVSGIGCSSRISAYVDFNTVHTAHGRALTFATGLKMARPELNVVVVTGDGDATAIGGNHFIHAARRNLDLTVILVNNLIYGMTGGQASPTTPVGKRSTTTPYGQSEPNFNVSGLAQAAGATFVARTTTYHAKECERMIVKGLKNKGFSLIEVVAACPTSFGRQNREGDPVEMLHWQKESAVPIAAAKTMSPEELEGKIVTGVFVDQPRPEFGEEYRAMCERIRNEGGRSK